MSAANAMIQEFQPTFHKGWYNEFVDPNLDIRDGFLHALQKPEIGTRLRPEVFQRPDVTVVVSDQPGESPIDAWYTAPVHTAQMEAEIQRLRKERGPQ